MGQSHRYDLDFLRYWDMGHLRWSPRDEAGNNNGRVMVSCIRACRYRYHRAMVGEIMNCGCKIVQAITYEPLDIKPEIMIHGTHAIVFCPLHKAAEEMKYALHQARSLLIDEGITNDLIDKAIAKAEGRHE